MLQAAYTKEVDGARAAIYKMVEGTMSAFACARLRGALLFHARTVKGARSRRLRALCAAGPLNFYKLKIIGKNQLPAMASLLS